MFAPNHSWLGIPPGRRPPTDYRLLGIGPGETDPDVIAASMERQAGYVRHFRAGPHAEDGSRLLVELARAMRTLIDPGRRSACDAGLAPPSSVKWPGQRRSPGRTMTTMRPLIRTSTANRRSNTPAR